MSTAAPARRIQFQHNAPQLITERPEVLERIQSSENTSNHDAVIAAFVARGIPADQILPRENVLTYRAWLEVGRQVKRGEKSVKIDVWVDAETKTDGKTTRRKFRRSVAVFHISQTTEIEPGTRPAPTRPAADQTLTVKITFKRHPWAVPTFMHMSGCPSIDHAITVFKQSCPGFEIVQACVNQVDQPTREPNNRTTSAPVPQQRGVTAARLRELADNMQSKIDAKLDTGCGRQRYTQRRARMAASMRADGYRLQDVQRARRQMADAIDAGELPECLVGVYSESDLMRLTRPVYGHENLTADERAAREWLSNNFESQAQRAEREAAERMRELNDSILANPPDGFFPTPSALAVRMAEMLELRAGVEVLEPSAGSGALCDAVREVQRRYDWMSDVTLTIVEVNHRLCEFLRTKNYEPHQGDILTMRGTVDRVIMNPPYENKQDIRHVRHCFDMLAPGGVMVALISTGFQFRSDRETEDFRTWLQTVPTVQHVEVIENAFNGAQSQRQTGVRVALLKLRKPQ